MANSTVGKSITIKGSAQLVTEFFGYGINTILYQREIYPAEQFERKKKYGLTLLVTSDAELKSYLNGVLGQLNKWLQSKTVQKVIVVIADAGTGETAERWQFDIECENQENQTPNAAPAQDKSEKEIQSEIQAIIRQITGSVTFLPLIQTQCTFEVLVYTDKDSETPMEWVESDAKHVQGGSQVMPLRHFSTGHHAVKAAVCYRDES
eukprot:m.264374 g.264374  ORF g.264374 m.264374 type:complete len:207 (-) comp55831_c0_seq1:37-657(-)